LIGVEARFAPLTHAQHIGWPEAKV
jgi:hypothetical protein